MKRLIADYVHVQQFILYIYYIYYEASEWPV